MNFDLIFKPQSIALIGASRDQQSVGGSLLKNLLNPSYTGHIYPVNPKATELFGVPVFSSISQINQPVDLAIIAIPAPAVLSVVSDAIAKGVKAIVVISAGFKEQGEEGKRRELELVSLCNAHNVLLVGPNCLGILNPHIGLNASFETVLPIPGKIACISQSGALISSLIDIANERGIGFSKIVSVGNKAAITENELLPFLFNDPETSVITLYTEALHDANALIGQLHLNQLSQTPKPVIMLKAGVTQEGQHASSSHTGSLAGSDLAYQAIANQAGIIRVRSMDELLTTAHVCQNNPLPKGNKITIITNAGGPGILATDEASRLSLALSKFSLDTEQALTAMLPPNSHPTNPVDLLGDASAERYEKALTIVAGDTQVDSIITIVTPQSMTEIPETAAAIIRARNGNQKPMVASFIGATQTDYGQFLLAASGVAHSQFPEPAVTALGHLTAFANTVTSRKQEEKPVFTHVDTTSIQFPMNTTTTLLDTNTVFKLLTQANIQIVRSMLVQSAEAAQEYANHVNTNLALKIVSPDISHKTDVGGVLLNVKPEHAGESFKKILENIRQSVPQARTDGVLVTEMIDSEGIEFFIGMKREPNLGNLMLVGMGGIYVEIFKDIASSFAPLSKQQAERMINSLQGSALIRGTRGKNPLDMNAFVDVLVKVSNLVLSIPQLKELDINPLFVRPNGQGVIVLDARMIVE